MNRISFRVMFVRIGKQMSCDEEKGGGITWRVLVLVWEGSEATDSVRNSFQKLIDCQLVKKRPEIYGSRTFITTICPYPGPDESSPRPSPLQSTLIFFFHKILGRTSDLPSGSRIKAIYTFLFSPIRSTCFTHLISSYLITVITFCQ